MALHLRLVAAAALFSAASAAFVHPGVVYSANQLAFVKAQVEAQQEPFYTAYRKALASPAAKLDYTPRGPPASKVIECGSYSHPDFGCTDESLDGQAALLQALLYHLNGTSTYASNAIAIMNGYSSVQLYNNTNAPLQSAWGAEKWTRAAELIIHSDAGWPAEDAAAFQQFMYRATLPLSYPGSSANGNWEDSMIEGMMGLAVLSENSTLWEHATTFWSQRVPAYFYISSDGDKPVPSPRGGTWWFNQLVFNSSVDGICQETCRDLGHMQYGLAALINAAETAYVQGLDLYGTEQTRLVAALEFHAHLLLPNVTAPDYVCNGTGVKTSLAPTFEIAYNHYHNRKGIELPYTYQHIVTAVRNMSDPEDMFMMVYETLTHGGNAPQEGRGDAAGAGGQQ
jgi:hypothetical protein